MKKAAADKATLLERDELTRRYGPRPERVAQVDAPTIDGERDEAGRCPFLLGLGWLVVVGVIVVKVRLPRRRPPF